MLSLRVGILQSDVNMVAEWVTVLKQCYAGMKMIVVRDKLDGAQGVRHKTQAFKRFLEKYKDFQGKARLLSTLFFIEN